MYRVIVLYENEPDAEQYAEHVEVARRVPGCSFRHGRIFGSPMGDPKFGYYAEFEFADKAAFDAGVRSEEFAASGRDVQERGMEFPTIMFAEVS
jgi:uncharacterized protein (TIGR02118 family)